MLALENTIQKLKFEIGKNVTNEADSWTQLLPRKFPACRSEFKTTTPLLPSTGNLHAIATCAYHQRNTVLNLEIPNCKV